MIRQAIIAFLIGFGLMGCLQQTLFGCRESPNYKYCPK